MNTLELAVKQYFENAGHFYEPWEQEADLLAKTTDMLRMLKAVTVREAWATKSGISDLLVCYKGMFIAIELKDDVGEPTQQQLNFITKVMDAGGRGAVCRTLSKVFKLLVS